MADGYVWKLGFETAEVEGKRSGVERRAGKERREEVNRGVFSNRAIERRRLDARRAASDRRRKVPPHQIETAVEKAGPLFIGGILMLLGLGSLVMGIKYIPVPGIILAVLFLPCSLYCIYSFFGRNSSTP